MTEIRYVQMKDKEFWYKLDKHLPKQEFEKKFTAKLRIYYQKTILQSDCSDIIFFGTIYLFVLCCTLMKNIRKKVTGENCCNIGKLK